MKKNKNIIVVLIFISSIFCSCQDQYNICSLPTKTDIKAGLYQKIGGVESVATSSQFSLGVYNSTMLIYDKLLNYSKFAITLPAAADSAKYFIKLSDILPADTISLYYTTQNFVVSDECGTVPVFNITRVATTLNTVDSVKIINPTINTTSTENIKIYY